MTKQRKLIIVFIAIIILLITIYVINNETNSFPRTEELAITKKENKDTIGWIYIPKTNIDYPILYKENDYYIDKSFEKENVTSGSIHTNYGKKRQNIVITGHNSRVSVAKFYWLHNIKDINLGLEKSCYEVNDLKLDENEMPNFKNKEDQIWYISVFGIEGKWQIWSMYETPPEESAETLYYNTWHETNDNKYYPQTENDINNWIQKILSKSEYDFKTDVNSKDQFITVYTCGCQYYDYDHGSRLYFFLKKI